MSRPIVAIISNSLTPYRLHFHLRLVRELTEVEWCSLFTHDISNAPWSLTDEAEIQPVRFGVGERADDQSKLMNATHEYAKGGRIIQWLINHNVQAVILLGYNDPGRIRVLRWCHGRRIPCFLFGDSNVRGDQAAGAKARLKRLMLPYLLKKCTGVLACGSLGRQYFRAYGVPDASIWYAPYEPDYDAIREITPSEIDACFSSHSLPRDRKYIVYCGRLVNIKRVDLLLDAFASVANERSDWDLVIVGDGPLRDELESRLPERLRGRVHWLGFINDQAVVGRLQRGGAVLVLPSDDEPWGVVINEAVAAGMAVVASDVVGAAAELVRDGVNGRLFPRGDAAKLIAALREVTVPEILAKFREASATVLAEWRTVGEPVRGVEAALASVGIRVRE